MNIFLLLKNLSKVYYYSLEIIQNGFGLCCISKVCGHQGQDLGRKELGPSKERCGQQKLVDHQCRSSWIERVIRLFLIEISCQFLKRDSLGYWLNFLTLILVTKDNCITLAEKRTLNKINRNNKLMVDRVFIKQKVTQKLRWYLII
jgi:hypothetical protein